MGSTVDVYLIHYLNEYKIDYRTTETERILSFLLTKKNEEFFEQDLNLNRDKRVRFITLRNGAYEREFAY